MKQEQEQPSSGKDLHREDASSGDQEISNKSAMSDGGLESQRYRIERRAVNVAVFALIVSIVTGVFQVWLTSRQADIGERQAEISAEQAMLSEQQNMLSGEGIQAARFQSIYERMLDVGRMLAEKPTVAQVIYQTDADTAAEIYVLDFDMYVWDNVRYLIKPDAAQYPSRFSLRDPLPGSKPVEKTEGWTDIEWEAWQTWSETIIGHFRSRSGNSESDPGQLCSVLNDSRDAYTTDFVDAVVASHVCPVSVLPPS